MDTLKSVLVPINREGYKFIAIFAVATLILFAIWVPLGWIGVILTLWCAYFFRDPERMVPQGEGLVIAPADGVVQLVGPAVPPAELGMGTDPRPRICIFMNVFNVHVNRNPVSGRVVALAYRPGKFVNAALDKASTDNERQSIRLRTEEGKEFAVVQIAGLVARRILCELTEGQGVRAGDRFGLIRFVSRVDVYLDPRMIPQGSPGQTTIAGETDLADYGPAPIAARLAERN
ncbi:MAG: phosphatidylserine decarboxylase [Ferrovibrionaceae bacterium]